MHCGFPVVAAKQVVALAEPLGVLAQEPFQQCASYVWTGPRATQNTAAKPRTFLVWLKAAGQHVLLFDNSSLWLRALAENQFSVWCERSGRGAPPGD